MFCIFHDWEEVDDDLNRFHSFSTVKECSKCDKLSIDLDEERIDEFPTLELQTDARVVITMDQFVATSAENYPNEYEVKVAWEIMKYF